MINDINNYSKNEAVCSSEHKYDDIINLPHHVSKNHPQMAAQDRAAQFSPFAALTGHGEAIAETARLMEERRELDENSVEDLNMKLQKLKDDLNKKPVVSITYFVADERKQGGSYMTVTGCVKKIDEYGHRIIMETGDDILIDDLVAIENNIKNFI